MLESNLAVTEAFGTADAANDPAFEGALAIQGLPDRFCEDVPALTLRAERGPRRRRSKAASFSDGSAHLFRPFRVF